MYPVHVKLPIDANGFVDGNVVIKNDGDAEYYKDAVLIKGNLEFDGNVIFNSPVLEGVSGSLILRKQALVSLPKCNVVGGNVYLWNQSELDAGVQSIGKSLILNNEANARLVNCKLIGSIDGGDISLSGTSHVKLPLLERINGKVELSGDTSVMSRYLVRHVVAEQKKAAMVLMDSAKKVSDSGEIRNISISKRALSKSSPALSMEKKHWTEEEITAAAGVVRENSGHINVLKTDSEKQHWTAEEISDVAHAAMLAHESGAKRITRWSPNPINESKWSKQDCGYFPIFVHSQFSGSGVRRTLSLCLNENCNGLVIILSSILPLGDRDIFTLPVDVFNTLNISEASRRMEKAIKDVANENSDNTDASGTVPSLAKPRKMRP